MAKTNPTNSTALKAVAKRLKQSDLSAADKAILLSVLSSTIELRQVLEKSTKKLGGKKVIASLPFGFDIVK
jgi:hypothetical protein